MWEIIHTPPPSFQVDKLSMNSGYATDGSDGSNSNKRSRSDDGAAARSTTTRNKRDDSKSGGKKHPTPLEVGKAVADQYIASLHPGLHKLLEKHAHAVLGAYTTYFRAESKYTRENNDTNYIPQSCRITLALQPTSRVAKSDGFKNQTREATTVVEQCRQLLKSEWMKTAYRNTLDYKEDVARKLMKSLHEISKLLCAQECKRAVTNMEHQAVADFLRENHRQVFTFLGVEAIAEKEEELKKLYCSVNGIDAFPPPSMNQPPPPTPPTATAPQAPQNTPQQVAPAGTSQQPPQAPPEESALTIRGGGGGGADELLLSDDLLALESEEEEDSSQQLSSQNTLVVAAAAFEGQASTSRVPPLTQMGSPCAEDTNAANMPQAEEELRGGEFAQIEQRLIQESQERRDATHVTPVSAVRRAEAFRQNLAVRFGGVETVADAVMAEASDERRESTPFAEPEGGGPQQQQDGVRHHDQQRQEPPPTEEAADQGLRRMELRKVVSLLAGMFDQIFVRPRSRYNLQVETNDTAFRIFKAEKSLTIAEKADKVTEAIQAEGTVNSKVIKVMILDEVRKELAKKKKLESKKSTSTSTKDTPKKTTAKNKKGAKGGGAQPKKSTHKPSAGKGAAGSNNATTRNSSSEGPKPTPKNKNKKGKASKKGKGK